MGGLGWVLVLASWVGLGSVKKNGPMSISGVTHTRRADRSNCLTGVVGRQMSTQFVDGLSLGSEWQWKLERSAAVARRLVGSGRVWSNLKTGVIDADLHTSQR